MKRHPSLVGVVLAALLGLVLVGCSDDDGQQQNNNNTIQNNNNSQTDCGDGVMESPEECDDGTMNSDTTPNVCRADCTLPECGDGVVDTAAPYNETCDPPGGSCQSDCTMAQTACDEADSYDTDCETATSGQWCWDGGVSGGPLFCGCEYGSDCQIEGYGMCNETTHMCEATPDCGTDANEPNDTEATATTLALSTNGSGAVCEYDDDWFTFTTGSGDNAATITVTWTDDSETDLDLRVTDCNDLYVAGGSSSDPAEEEVVADDLEASTAYCVRVRHYSGPAGGGMDVNYTINVVGSYITPPCILDSECTTPGDYCPYVGDDKGVCVSSAPANAGCGDNANGDNDTSQNAETLTSGVAVTEGTCDGEPTGPLDVDWFTFTAGADDEIQIVVDQTGDNTNGDVDVWLYDSNGDRVASSVTFTDPEQIDVTDAAAGDYYVVVKFYDRQTGTPMSDTYSITMTLNP